MKKKTNIFLVLGILLILGSMAWLMYSQIYARHAQTTAKQLTAQIEVLLPERYAAVAEAYANPDMPVLQVKGIDFSALIEVPAFGVTLPVCSEWNTELLHDFPCRFSGSTYSNSLIIGGSDQYGQFDFFTQLDTGELIIITDMLGAEYTYTAERIERSKSADYSRLSSADYPLTLFVRDSYSMDYILVRCK